MVKKGLMLLLFVWFTNIAFAQMGKVFDNLSMKSTILNSERKYAIYLPPDYVSSNRSYPVLYLLHGSGDDQTGWVQFGEVSNITDKAIREGKSTPMIIVMPDASSERKGYFNAIDGKWNYEDFFFEELIPFIEKTYRVKALKQYRSVAGLSMGGGGSMMYALHRPDMFSSAAPLSASVGPLEVEILKSYMKKDDGKDYSDKEYQNYFDRHSGVELVNRLPLEQLSSVRWYIDCGDDDFLFEGNSLVHIAMKKREIEHEYRVRDGGHTWTYWRESLPEVLYFVSQAFHQY